MVGLGWLAIACVGVGTLLLLMWRAHRQLGQALRAERLARAEAEALASVAAAMAAGNGRVQDTLDAAVSASARVFGGEKRCMVMLPQPDGALRPVAWNYAAGARIAAFKFTPGQGTVGRAFSEGRVITVADLTRLPNRRADVKQAATARSLVAAPMIADQRTLGVLVASSLEPGAFDARDERILSAIAGQVAVALVGSEAHEAAQRESAELRRAATALRESEERYRLLVELCPDPIIVHRDGVFVYANPATNSITGTSSVEELIGRPIGDFVHPDFRESVVQRARTSSERREHTRRESTLLRADGELIQIESTTMPITFEGRPAIQAVVRDVTERKRAEAALAYQALHDALTGLPNRVLLLDRLEQAVVAARRENSHVSLLLMDLDRFKEVNDTLGHHAGDLLLQQVGTRLRGALRQADTIARLGGDEFAVILPGTDASGMVKVVENLLRRLQAPFTVEGQPVVIGGSIGVALAPEHGEAADVLMRRADVAMYVAKRASSGFAVYRAEQDRNSPERLSMISDLRRAVEQAELVLHYQPKLELRGGKLAGVEALVRWEHPLRGLVTPDQFIELAEQASLIEPLTRWVLRAALMQASAWRRVGLDVPIAVNLSMRSLHDEHLPDTIAELLHATGAPARLLVLEITESSLMVDPPQTMAILERLRAMGIRVSLDDFGTGHSSLTYLKRLPVDEVKIDRSFVVDIATDETDRVIVRSTVDLAHSLGLRVVAEGVEDDVTAVILAELGCDQAQGFHLGRPLRGHELTHWLCTRRSDEVGPEERAA